MTICSPARPDVIAAPGGAQLLRLGASPASVSDARQWVCDRAAAMGASARALHVLELLTSELVTNAVKYGPATGTITVIAERHGGVMDVAVSDEGNTFPVVREPGTGDLGGRGLLMVQALAQQWGVELHADKGKWVWFHAVV